MGRLEKYLEIIESAVAGVNRTIVGDIVSVIAQRGREEWHQPQGCDAKVLQVIQFLGEPAKISDAVRIAVVEGPNVDLIDDRVLVPERVLGQCQNYLS